MLREKDQCVTWNKQPGENTKANTLVAPIKDSRSEKPKDRK